MKKSFFEVEALIKERLEILAEEYDLCSWDILDIRDAVYKENGWNGDPFPVEEEEEYDPEAEEQAALAACFTCSYFRELWESDMHERDFY